MNLELLSHLFINYQMSRIKEDSVQHDKTHLISIINYFHSLEIFDTDNITFEHLDKYVYECKLKGNKSVTINKRIDVLKRALKHAVRRKKAKPSDLLNFEKLKEINERFEIVSDLDMIKILNYVDSEPLIYKYLNKRNRLIVYLLVDTGCRRTELTYIDVKNIDFNTKTILLTKTKTSRKRYVCFSDVTLRILLDYLNDYDYPFLFKSYSSDNRMSTRSVSRLFERISKETGVHVTAHMLRHTYATLSANLKISDQFTTEILGHSDSRLLGLYTHYDQNLLSKIYKDVQPMNHYKTKIK